MRSLPSAPVAAVVATTFLAAPAFAGAGGHADPVAPVLLGLAAILVAAKLAGALATRVGQPAVLGELLAGVVIGNLDLATGWTGAEALAGAPAVDLLARLGVIVLLFEVGLESTVGQMLRVGGSAALVALLGVAAPFALGWGVAAWLLPGHSAHAHAFLGAALTATSVGITARVLKDLGRSRGPEARVILGAAVIDDVLGLVILAVVAGVIAAADGGGALALGGVATIVAKAGGFLLGALAVGRWVVPRLFGSAARLPASGVLLAAALAFCFALAWLAGALGLAPIVGAFAAGLVLEDVHLGGFKERGEHGLEELLRPIAGLLLPFFFVAMGARTDLAAFADLGVLGLAAALAGAAVIGKQLCSLGVVGGAADRWTVGIGMIPRGEVGLIFADIGLGLEIGGERIVDPPTFAALVLVVIATTMVTPPLLAARLRRVPPPSA